MKISFWIPAIVLYAVSIAFSNSVKVGTVLFTATDLVRRCWTENERSVLRARLVMQDVLPDPDCIDFSNPKAAVVLLDYFLACFEIISKSSYGKIQNLMYIALSDALGGYLRAYVLPSVNRAYYAGQMKYSEVESLYALYDNIRTFLKASGGGWAEPQKLSRKKFHVLPLVITGGAFEACKQLHIIEKKGKAHCITSPCSRGNSFSELKNIKCTKNSKEGYRKEKWESFKNSKYFPNSTFSQRLSTKNSQSDEKNGLINEIKKVNCNSENITVGYKKPIKDSLKILANETKRPLKNSSPQGEVNPGPREIPRKKKRSCGWTCSHRSGSRSFKTVIVPLPMLDDCQTPQSIIVPFKDRPFRNLHSASSAFILEYYYIAVIKCFLAKGNTRVDIKNFNAEFYSWLVSEVLPHLNDERWYPGFGGVLRVVETIKKIGTTSGLNEPCFHDTGFAFKKGVEFDIGDTLNKEESLGSNQPHNTPRENSPNSKRHVITTILVVSLLWLFLFCAYVFYSQATKGRDFLGSLGGIYGGCLESTSRRVRTQPESLCTCPNGKNKSINFQFFIKLFKNQEQKEEKLCIDKEKQVYWSIRKLKNDNPLEKKLLGAKHQVQAQIKKKLNFKCIDQSKEAIQGQDDFSIFKHSKQEEPFKPILPIWPSDKPCFVRAGLQFHPDSAGDAKPVHYQKLSDDVTLLWKKPSVKFKESKKSPRGKYKMAFGGTTTPNTIMSSYLYSGSMEESRYTSTKQNACCCCDESCQHTTCTNCSSLTEMKMTPSSTTMEFFKHVKIKRKPFMKKESTEESECDDEASTSCGSHY